MVDYVEQLLQFRRSRVTPEQIGVITPFAKQVATPRAQPATLCCQPATPCTQTCNPVHPDLQPRASRPATPCIQTCNPVHPDLQPRAPRPATLCTQACIPVHPGLHPRAPRPAARAPSAWPHVITPFAVQAQKIATLLRARGHMQTGGGVKVGGVESFQGQARAHACPRLQPYHARLQPYQLMHTCHPIRASPAAVLARLYIRSARPSSSRRCARRWASSSITNLSYPLTPTLTLTQPQPPNPNPNS